MRALGDLEPRVENDEGVPVAGVAVELESVELGESVIAWLEAGRVQSDGLRTDASGKLVVRRIPRGEYRWTIRTDGRSESGMFVVPSSRVARESTRFGG